jgi:hypothetical protein
MSTMPVQAHAGPSFGGFARVVSFLSTCVEVFLDAQREATAAHRRYPFTDGEASQVAPSTTRISRSTLPLPSALRAPL